MDIDRFIKYRRYLYHLTDPINYDSIFSDYKLKCTVALAKLADIPNKEEYLRTRRIGNKQPIFSKGKFKFSPRDQDPLREELLILEPGMSAKDYVYFLNSRVFFWAKETNLERHYKRYKRLGQKPYVLKISTKKLFDLNETPPLFCHFNSGMTSHWTHGLPVRGRSTFLLAKDYLKTPSSVKEVTFEWCCRLPKSLYLTKDLSEPFSKI